MDKGIYIKFDKTIILDADKTYMVGNDGTIKEIKIVNGVFKSDTYKHNIKISFLEKWITKGSFEFFTLDQFYRVYPKQKRNKNLDKIINSLIDKKIISSLMFYDSSGKEKYKVNR